MSSKLAINIMFVNEAFCEGFVRRDYLQIRRRRKMRWQTGRPPLLLCLVICEVLRNFKLLLATDTL